jgi:hypothetical protein
MPALIMAFRVRRTPKAAAILTMEIQTKATHLGPFTAHRKIAFIVSMA